ncbi:MAG: hypothetical protein IJ752_05685 [Alphaproteobacteria bacterium]|nr:hypothetical protein [Alphaproteobacteria bacterium]
MSWLEEAQQKIKQKQETAADTFDPNETEQRERLIRQLKMLYDNTTEREINKAVDEALDRFAPPYEEKGFMDFLRVKLED